MGMSLSKYIHVMNTEYFTNILHSGDKIHLMDKLESGK